MERVNNPEATIRTWTLTTAVAHFGTFYGLIFFLIFFFLHHSKNDFNSQHF